jgi:hypothetical protein
VRRPQFAHAGLALLATLVFGALLFTRPVRPALVFEVYLLVVAALAVSGFVRATRAAATDGEASAFEHALRPRERSAERPAGLERLEREVALAVASGFYVDSKLRPLATRIATERLLERRGIDLDASPGPAQKALPAEVWELVRPDRPPPHRDSPGAPLGDLRALVTALERI